MPQEVFARGHARTHEHATQQESRFSSDAPLPTRPVPRTLWRDGARSVGMSGAVRSPRAASQNGKDRFQETHKCRVKIVSSFGRLSKLSLRKLGQFWLRDCHISFAISRPKPPACF